jgi:hypothetical protein
LVWVVLTIFETVVVAGPAMALVANAVAARAARNNFMMIDSGELAQLQSGPVSVF